MKRRAFTLVELLVVIAIIGLLSTIAAISLNSARDKGKAGRMAGDLRAIRNALSGEILTKPYQRRRRRLAPSHG